MCSIVWCFACLLVFSMDGIVCRVYVVVCVRVFVYGFILVIVELVVIIDLILPT